MTHVQAISKEVYRGGKVFDLVDNCLFNNNSNRKRKEKSERKEFLFIYKSPVTCNVNMSYLRYGAAGAGRGEWSCDTHVAVTAL